MFDFAPEGTIQKAVILTSIQRINNYFDQLGQFYTLQTDKNNKTINILTREHSLDLGRRPRKGFT